MTILLTNAQKKNLLQKAKSGNYYVILTNYDDKKGQYIILFPTDKGLSNGLSFFRSVYHVRPPAIPLPPSVKKSPFNKVGGSAYKNGRFFVINNSIAKVLSFKTS